MAAPDLSLYLGQRVVSLTKGAEQWEWGIKLESGVEIRNKDVREIFRPMGITNMRLQSLSMSERDTMLHFVGSGAKKVTIAMPPTGYAIFDPKYGSEIFPQWPEELEEMGITANEGMAKPRLEAASEWQEEESRLKVVRDQRIGQEATEFMKDTEER